MAVAGKISILASVGRNGTNRYADVVTIQRLINDNLPIPLRPLVIDGRCGPATIAAIEEIQRRNLNMGAPDGRVDPHGATFRFLAGLPNAGAQTANASVTAEALVHDPRVKAMLDLLSFTEGTGTDYGKVVEGLVLTSPYYPELVGKRNVSVTNLSRHPDILVQVDATLKSTAAGRYQFLKSTWDGLGMSDFSAVSQDIAAVKLMQRRGMIAPLLAGDLDQAVYKGAPEWASLPIVTGGSYYGGQPARTIIEIRRVYQAALQKYSPVAGASGR
jgi:muramidase (phage lysozyme)